MKAHLVIGSHIAIGTIVLINALVFSSLYIWMGFVLYIIIESVVLYTVSMQATWMVFEKTSLYSQLDDDSQNQLVIRLRKLQPNNIIIKAYLVSEIMLNIRSKRVEEFEIKLLDELENKLKNTK